MLVSNYSAEYGSRAGGQIVVTVKNGTNQFHGSAYYFYRHESLNANEFFNNQAGVQRPLYRYGNEGGTFGGPLLIPGTRFNKSRTKLFFFYSEDYLSYLTPGGFNKFTMPTALERQGNFSQTVRLLKTDYDQESHHRQWPIRATSFPPADIARGIRDVEPLPAAVHLRPDRTTPVQRHLPNQPEQSARRPDPPPGLQRIG